MPESPNDVFHIYGYSSLMQKVQAEARMLDAAVTIKVIQFAATGGVRSGVPIQVLFPATLFSDREPSVLERLPSAPNGDRDFHFVSDSARAVFESLGVITSTPIASVRRRELGAIGTLLSIPTD